MTTTPAEAESARKAATAPLRSAVDLHAHSSASDGELDPDALVRHAAAAGVRTLALTDHDTLAGLDAAGRAARDTGVTLIPGVELSVTWESRTLHVVGLGFDPQSPALASGLTGLQQRRQQRAVAIGARVERLGVADAYLRAHALAAGGQITRSHFARLLVDTGVCRDARRAFQRYLSAGKPAYVGAQWATLEQAVGWLRAAGGVAVLAHPHRYTLGTGARMRLLEQFRTIGGQAIEVCCATSTPAEIQSSARHARELGLAGSVASDFHGRFQPWARIGAVAELPHGVTPVLELLDQGRTR